MKQMRFIYKSFQQQIFKQFYLQINILIQKNKNVSIIDKKATYKKQKDSTPVRIELTLPEGNGLAGRRLNHSAKVSFIIQKDFFEKNQTQMYYCMHILMW
ncbi:hypothetical protein ABPG72_006056 [Tetrahymena utriculariae]